MIVKRYVVKDMPEALTKIRQDLGHNAVILSSKKIKQSGFFGIFSISKLAVVAAVNDAEQTDQVKPSSAVEKQTVAMHAVDTTDSAFVTPKETRQDVTPAAEEQPVSGTSPDVLKEVKELRGVLSKFLQQNTDLLPDFVQRIRLDLIENDVSPENVEALILRVLQENNEINSMEEQEFRHILTNLIEKEINSFYPTSSFSPTARVIAFVGPTGVGKTTTIAKIAAVEMLKNRRKVGFITTDTFRIAAVEQLKIYGNILQVPVEVVFSSDELAQAIETLKDRDLILIDTAGRNYGSSDLVSELNRFLLASQPDETCLVLSLTTKSSDLERIVANFDGVPIDKFIFTKLDETNSYGAMYNLLHLYRKPLAFLTHGQNVPDDIETATSERIARLVVGEKQYV